jgi:hypothetical protein
MENEDLRRRVSFSHQLGGLDGAWTSTRTDGLTQGTSIMSTTKAPTPRPRRLLDGFPPDTRIVVAGVTWRDNYFDPAKIAAAAATAHSDDVDLYPNPDLAVEVDISPPKIDRLGIYAALQVPEFWRIRNKAVSIEQLGPDGKYVSVQRSRFLPVRPEDVTRWVFIEDSTSLITWEERLREWVRTITA